MLAIDPRSAIAANNLAWIYLDSGENLDIALQLAQTAKAALPNLPQVNDTLGWIFYKKGLFSLAEGPLKLAVERDNNPADPTYQKNPVLPVPPRDGAGQEREERGGQGGASGGAGPQTGLRRRGRRAQDAGVVERA